MKNVLIFLKAIKKRFMSDNLLYLINVGFSDFDGVSEELYRLKLNG